MSKKILGEIAYLKRMSKNVIAGESRDRVNDLIELYSKRKITQSSTVENIIKAFIGAKTLKQRVAVHAKSDAIMEKYKEAQTLAERLATKRAAKEVLTGRATAASKIQKTVRGIVQFKTSVLEKSMKTNVLRIGVASITVGSAMATQVEAYVARAYLMARRELPKNAVFKLWATCNCLYYTPDEDNKSYAKGYMTDTLELSANLVDLMMKNSSEENWPEGFKTKELRQKNKVMIKKMKSKFYSTYS